MSPLELLQLRGSGDLKGIQYTMRFKLMLCCLLSVVAGFAFCFLADPLIGLYLTGEGSAQLAADTLKAGREYMYMMLWGMLPFAVLAIYAICNSMDLIKCIVGRILIRGGTWVQYLTDPEQQEN